MCVLFEGRGTCRLLASVCAPTYVQHLNGSVCEQQRETEKPKPRRKLLIILAPIRRNTLSQYPWRRVMNASYCSPADIRHSSPPSSPPPSSILRSQSHVPFPLLLFYSSIPALVHPSCNMHLSPPTTLVFLAFCSPCQPFCSNFPSPPRSFTSPISLSPDSFSSFIIFASDFVPHKLPSSSSFNPAPPSFSIPLLLHLCCLSSCSPTQITHLCHTDFLLRECVCVCVCAPLGDHLETRSLPRLRSRFGFYPQLSCSGSNTPTAQQSSQSEATSLFQKTCGLKRHWTHRRTHPHRARQRSRETDRRDIFSICKSFFYKIAVTRI